MVKHMNECGYDGWGEKVQTAWKTERRRVEREERLKARYIYSSPPSSLVLSVHSCCKQSFSHASSFMLLCCICVCEERSERQMRRGLGLSHFTFWKCLCFNQFSFLSSEHFVLHPWKYASNIKLQSWPLLLTCVSLVCFLSLFCSLLYS